MSDTLLVLSGIGIPQYSARGLTQTITPIQQASQFRRTINAGLVNLTPTVFHKYRSEITCTDQRTPAIDGIWPGAAVTVSCVCELSYPTGGSPSRAVVSGSSRTEGGFVFYRPVLNMIVTEISDQLAEWRADYAWKLGLEEA